MGRGQKIQYAILLLIIGLFLIFAPAYIFEQIKNTVFGWIMTIIGFGLVFWGFYYSYKHELMRE